MRFKLKRLRDGKLQIWVLFNPGMEWALLGTVNRRVDPLLWAVMMDRAVTDGSYFNVDVEQE